jgi:23S rRNA (pseudouridine1915-N3)-methyltransferase
MKVHLWAFGAPSDGWVAQGEQLYVTRIGRYLPFEYKHVQASRQTLPKQVLAEEAAWFRQQIKNTPSKYILLDEKGPQLTSTAFSVKLDQWRQGSHRRLIFLIGSAYGFDESLYKDADSLLGLSKMTLPHQLCRLIFLEQIYRACTILRGESYHHE